MTWTFDCKKTVRGKGIYNDLCFCRSLCLMFGENAFISITGLRFWCIMHAKEAL